MRIVNANVTLTSESLRKEVATQDKREQPLSRAPVAQRAGIQLSISQEASYDVTRNQRVSYQSAAEVSDNQTITNQALSTVLSEATRFALSGEAAISFITSQASGTGPGVSGQMQAQFSSYVYRQTDEQVRLSVEGRLSDSSGRDIRFTVYLEQQQHTQWREKQSLSIEARPLTDPLVINFGNDVVRLSDVTFKFDLNADGNPEQLGIPQAGSGFLVFDRNADGKINDGSEMFGPLTGNGYSELAMEDSDGNGWIDESDPVFSQLRVMVIAPEGPQLKSLAELGVGAIGLHAGDTRLSLTSPRGMLLGEVKRTGVVLMENGSVRTMQELDLADLKASPTTPSKPWRNGEILSGGRPSPRLDSSVSEAPLQDDAFVSMVKKALEKMSEIEAQMEAQMDEKAPPPSLLEQLLKAMKTQMLQLQQQREGARNYRATSSHE